MRLRISRLPILIGEAGSGSPSMASPWSQEVHPASLVSNSEIPMRDFRVLHQFLRLGFVHDPSLAHHVDPVGQAYCEREFCSTNRIANPLSFSSTITSAKS